MPPTQYATAGGPLIAIAALVVIVLICRWVFSTRERDARTASRLEKATQKAAARGDYGLLVPVATVRVDRDAELLRAVLREAGIRGTVAEGGQPGERVLLVFRAEADRARSLVSG